MYFPKSRFLIVGVSKSGKGACRLLLSRGAECYVYDDGESDAVIAAEEELVSLGAKAVGKNEVDGVLPLCDVVVLSPGVPIDHEIPVRAKRAGKRVIGELELASSLCVNPVVAVTGTNGKTTICTMLGCVLKAGGLSPVLCGNIGNPFSCVLDSLAKKDVVVAEVSSFQLETTARFAPHIAVIANITPDHLSRHYNMENYVFVKSKILSNLKESEYAVLNYDDAVVRKLGEKTEGKVIAFSVKDEVNGCYLSAGKIYFKGKFVAEESDLPLRGEHDIENALAAICVGEILGIGGDAIVAGLKAFKGVRHRIEYVGTFGGTDFFNDSKATNPDATVKAIETMKKPCLLILGGKNKGLSFSEVFSAIPGSTVKHVIATGESRYALFEEAKRKNYDEISVVKDFRAATELACLLAGKGDCVLLSPACSSFDCFSDYEERGDRFTEIVKGFFADEPD